MAFKKSILCAVIFMLLCTTARAYDIKLLSEIPVKSNVTGIALTPAMDTAAVVSESTQSLSIVNTVSSAVLQVVLLPEAPSGVAVHKTSNIAVVFSGKGTIFLVDLGSGELTATFSAGKPVYAVAVDETNNKAILGVDDGLRIIDLAGKESPVDIACSGKSVSLVLTKNGYIVASESDSGTWLRLIDQATNKIVKETALAGRPLGIAQEAALGCLLITQSNKPGLLLYDLATLQPLGQIETQKQHEIIAVNPSAHTAVLADTQDGSITVADLEQKTVLATASLFGHAGPLGMDTGRNRVLVAYGKILALLQLENPIPSINVLEPREGSTGESDLPLSITGEKFLKESQTWFNNSSLSTFFDSNELLRAVIPSDHLRYPGDVAVSVCNPPPGGGKSNELKFKILTPVPQLTSLAPETAVIATATTLRVVGQNFLPTAVISLNGKKLATRYLSSIALEATVSPALLASLGSLPVSVTNSGQASFTSNTLNLQVTTAEEAAAQAAKTQATKTAAVQGTGSLSGRILNTDMQPVVGVTVKCKNLTAQTDVNGKFTIENLPEGKRTILIDGSTAVDSVGHYPNIPISVDIIANQKNPMPFIPYFHRQKNRNFVNINPAMETVLTDPEVPGFEMRIPKGVNIVGWDGKANTKVSVRTVPVNRLPVKPVPANANIRTVYMFYFNKVGGGKPDRPIPVKAPNDLGLLPGEKAVLWYYDESPNEGEAPNDWAIAGTGTVTADGKYIVSDSGVGIPKYCCGATAWGGTSASLPTTGKEACGLVCDPVDIATGYFVHEKTDLVIPGIIPVRISRHYRSRDGGSAVQNSTNGLGAFGKGMYFEYDWWVGSYGSVLRLTKPGSYQYDFVQQADGSYLNTTDPEFSGSKLTVNTDSTKTLRIRDGWIYSFNYNGELVQVSDRYGNAITINREHGDIFHDQGGRVASITTAEGRVVTFNATYVGGNFMRIDSISDQYGRTINYTYDSDPFNNYPRLRQVSYPDGSAIQYGYDTNSGLMTTFTNGRGIVEVTNAYDTNQRVVSQTHADGGVYTFDYSVAGQTTMTSPNSAQTSWSYNAYGYITQKITPDGTTTYNKTSGTNQLSSVTDPLNRTTSYSYYATSDARNGLIQSITDPLANVTSYEYETTYGLPTKITDARGKINTISYTPSGAPPTQAVISDPLSNQTTVIFNSYGMPTSIADPNNHTTTFTYDSNLHAELTRVTDALGNATRYSYNPIGWLASATDANGKTAQYGYTPLGRVASVTDPVGNTTHYLYDPNGNLSTVSDAKNHSIYYEYDGRDRITKMTDQLGRYETYAYYTGTQITSTTGDNLKSYTDRKGQTTTINQYDAMNRIHLVTFGDNSTTSFSYDAAGRATGITDSISGTIGFTYNDFGCTNCAGRGLDRIAQETTTLSTLSYTYDANGRRASMTVANEPAVTYGYDDAGRLTSLARVIGSTSRTYNIGYDNAGRRNALQIPLAAANSFVTTTYGYDIANRLTGMLLQGAAAQIDNLTYTYDPNGNRTSFTRTVAQALSPPVSGTSYDAANQMLTYNGKNLSYDQNGNLQSRIDVCGTTAYTWDARNRLTAINGYKSDCTALTASFSYDALNRRTSKTINGTTTQYVYDGSDIIQEITNSVKTNYVRTLDIDEPLTRISGSSIRHYVKDALGSTLALTDDTGAAVTTYTYDAFGNMTASGEASENPFQYTGRENDGTGLLYYRARYYSPEMQRFLSEDPIRLNGGDINFFTYISNNPVNWVDPEGLQQRSPYGEITMPPSLPKRALDYVYTDFRNFVDPSHPNANIDVFMKYEGLALELGTGGGAIASPFHAAKDGWHYLNLGYHSVGKTVVCRNLGNAYEAGKYLHLNIFGKHFFLEASKIYQQIKYWKFLK